MQDNLIYVYFFKIFFVSIFKFDDGFEMSIAKVIIVKIQHYRVFPNKPLPPSLSFQTAPPPPILPELKQIVYLLTSCVKHGNMGLIIILKCARSTVFANFLFLSARRGGGGYLIRKPRSLHAIIISK